MTDELPEDITKLLNDIRSGHGEARDALINQVYEELHRMAVGLLRSERVGHTWGATGLVHEAFVRVLRTEILDQVENRRHFFGIASKLMCNLLGEHARTRARQKRGGDWNRLPLDDILDELAEKNIDTLALHEALERLETVGERQCQVVTLRFFGGFSVNEVADVLQVSVGTVERDFRIARAWLFTQLA